ncbi:MAG: MFS transporter [Desulfuromonadales bacterium]|nr:MFS transporter [Desulfuromonadales bacterium]MDW7757376.1 MFS transporter [Desulfuromonadales bacterium]
MTAYFRFFASHPAILSFGVLLTLFSSFGQTFLISIFVPYWLDTFRLDTAQFGILYSAATLLSAASLPYFGGLIDRVEVRRFSLAVGSCMVAACIFMAASPAVWALFLAILGLRLTGQGLLSLTASTTMARLFGKGRGRALSVSSLGYPLGEGLLPSLVLLLILGVGWRWSWAILGGVIALTLLPSMFLLLRGLQASDATPADPAPILRPRPALLRDWRFYGLLPGSIFLPLVLTALFLYQAPLGQDRGWSAQVMATAFIGFALARMAGSLLAGPWIDRWSATRLFPYILVPACAGLIFLSFGTSPWVALVYLLLVGFSQGIANPMMSALWAEVYGVESLGATKGTVATIGVFATALGPVLMGGLIKVGIPFSIILPGCVAMGLLAIGASLLMRWRLETTHGGEEPCVTTSI